LSIEAFNAWSTSVTALAAAILWQSALLACAVAGVCWLMRRASPALRYWSWQIVALKLLLMPWWIVVLPLPGWEDGGARTSPPSTARTESPLAKPDSALNPLLAAPAEETTAAAEETASGKAFLGQLTWRSWLVLAWLSAVTWQVGRLLVRGSRLRGLLGRATAAEEPRLLALLEEVRGQLELSARPMLVFTDEEGTPFVCGLLRPVLVLPRGLLAELDPDRWRELLVHELAHLKRRDLWWGWLPGLARLVYFFHPLVHWICFRIRLERELACDQLAMRLGGRGPAEYAALLVQVVSHASMPAAWFLSARAGLSTFWKRRLIMLHSTSRSAPRLSRLTRLSLAAAGLAACVTPTLLHATAQAEPQAVQPAAQARACLYVSARLRYKAEGEDQEKDYNLIMAIDPDTGKWRKIADSGHAPRVSPDRQTVVFSRLNEGLWNCDTGGSNNPGRISNKVGRPNWSPDGKHLVATRQQDLDKDDKPRTTPAWKDETWRLDADGRNPLKLAIPDTDSVEDWSPDGQWFVTCSDRHPPYGRGYQLYLMKTDGTAQRRLTQGGLNVYSRFSPDGKKILYLHQTAKAGNSIWTVDVDGKNAREIVKEVDLASPDGAFWSPDGKQIAVILFNWELDEKGKKISRGLEAANFRMEIMNADGTGRRELQLQGARFRFIGSLGDWR
jgi:beta-lactamase regulating signal transducer with metallopeptidase domain/Tol biopolymer transport system component